MTIRMKTCMKTSQEDVKNYRDECEILQNLSNSYMKIGDDHPGHYPDPIILPGGGALVEGGGALVGTRKTVSLSPEGRCISPTQSEAVELLEPGRNIHFAEKT